MKSLPFGALCLVLGVSSAFALDATLVRVDGEESTGELRSIDAEKGIGVGAQTVKLAEIAEVRFSGASRAPAKEKPLIQLRNGDTLYASIASGDDNSIKVKSDLLGDLEIKNNSLRGILFPVKDGPPDTARAAFLGGEDPKEDHLLTLKGETVSGFLVKFTDKDLSFDAGGQKRAYAYDQVAGFRFAALEKFKLPEGAQALLNLADGSTLSGRLTALADDKLSLVNLDGATWSLPVKAVHSLGVKGGKLVHLSDLEPKVKEMPYVGGAPVVMHWRKDHSVIGEPLRIGKKEYARGLGVHSYAKLSYELGGQYARFLAEVGLDASAPSGAACAWRVVSDGKVLEKGDVKSGEAPKRLKLDITGARTLELICDFGSDNDDAGDHFDWSDARLVKQ